MKKMLICAMLVLCVVFSMVGCATGKTTLGYTFTVDTGDEINLVLDTTDGYSITPESPFVISCNDEVQSQGLFIHADDYHEYKTVVSETENSTVLETGKKGDFEYFMWKFDNGESVEFNYAVLVTEKTAILIGNDVSEETARECFDRLTISVGK